MYDIEVDVFSFGVMLVHVLSGQWPMPTEATQVNPHNPARVIGLSEVERRAEYLNVIGRPSDDEEGHSLMPLIERCLSNSSNLRPNASELVDAISDAVTQQPLTFSNRVEMMQRINSIQREKETLQTQVLELERQSQRQKTALTVEIEQLRLQVGNVEAEKTHIITTSTAREDLHHEEMTASNMQYQEELMAQQHQLKMTKTQYHDDLAAKDRVYEKNQTAKERQYQEELSKKQKQLIIKKRELQTSDNQLQVKTKELSSQTTLIAQQRSTIDGLHSQLQKVKQHLASGTQVSIFKL